MTAARIPLSGDVPPATPADRAETVEPRDPYTHLPTSSPTPCSSFPHFSGADCEPQIRTLKRLGAQASPRCFQKDYANMRS
jgi:hypothetical protein